MIELIEKSVLIKTSINQVYDYISNMENYGSWFPGVVKIVEHNNLDHGVVGKQYVETIQLPDGQINHTLEVVHAEKNRKYVTISETLKELLPQMTILLTGDSELCHVTWHFVLRNPDLKQDDEFVSALGVDLNQRAETGLANLKSMMESA